MKPKSTRAPVSAKSPYASGSGLAPIGESTTGGGAAAVRSVTPEPIPLVATVGFVLGMMAYGAWFLAGRRRRPAVGKRELAMDLANLRNRNIADHRPGAAQRIPDEEATVPRWLRRSVREERVWTPPPARRQTVIESPRATRFTPPALDSATRQPVDARVALLNVPNEALSTTITEIGRGDEVEVLQAAGEWLRVRTALGDEGWILSSALGGRPAS